MAENECLSPSQRILREHRRKLSNWDDFIIEQQKELETKKDSLHSLELKLAKIALSNINGKQKQISDWEISKRAQFEKEQRRIKLRTQRLDQQELELGNEKMTFSMQLKTQKMHQTKKINQQKIKLQMRESCIRKKEKKLNQDRKKLDEECREYEIFKKEMHEKQKQMSKLENDLRNKKIEIKLIESEYNRKINALNDETAKYMKLQSAIETKEIEYVRFFDNHKKEVEVLEKKKRLSVLKEKDLIQREEDLKECMQGFEQEMNERKQMWEEKNDRVTERSAQLELWANELRDFEHELEKKRIDLIKQKNQMTHLFDSYSAH